MKTSIKHMFECDNWIIIKVLDGLDGRVRIDAKRRFPVAGEKRFFSKWCNKKHADALSRERFGKNTNDLQAYSYYSRANK